MYVFTASGTAMKTPKGYLAHYCVTLSSDYVTSIKRRCNYVPKHKPRITDKFALRWENNFCNIAEDFSIDSQTIERIILEVASSAKPTDRSEILYARAMNKLYDMI